MSITVADCLKLPSLKEARVVSGHKGLSRIVSSVSVLEYAEPAILGNSLIFRANELILTAFASIRDDAKAQCRTLEQLHESGNVALILYYVGYFIKELDPQLLKKSEELSLPLIVMPQGRIDLPYNEVIAEVMESIFQDRYHETRFVNSMLERISQLKDRQRTVNNIMLMLSERLKSTLLLTDETLRVVNFTKRPLSSWLTEDILILPFTGAPLSEGIDFAELLCSTDFTVYRTPFSLNQRRFYLLAADDTRQITKEDLLSAAELLEISANIWKYKLDTDYLDSLIPAILNENQERTLLLAETFHIRLSELRTLGIVHLTDPQLSFYDRHRRYEQLAKEVSAILNDFSQPLLVNIYGELLIFLLYDLEAADEQELLTQIRQLLPPAKTNALLSVFSNSSLTEILSDFNQYCHNTETLQRIFPENRFFTSHHLRFAVECATERQTERFDPEQFFAPLKGHHDEEDLLITLATFLLDADSDTKRTGELLFLHRNTVQFRLNKIKQRLRCDFSQAPQSYACYKACALRRLHRPTNKNNKSLPEDV